MTKLIRGFVAVALSITSVYSPAVLANTAPLSNQPLTSPAVSPSTSTTIPSTSASAPAPTTTQFLANGGSLSAATPFTQASLIEKIQKELLAGTVVQSIQGIETGYADLVAAIAYEKADAAGNQNRHVFLYSTQGEAKLRADLGGQVGEPFLGLVIDQTKRIAVLKGRQLSLFALGQDNRIDLYGPSFNAETFLNVKNNTDGTISVQVYPKDFDGEEQVIAVQSNTSGELTVVRQGHFVPSAVLTALPKTASNPNFLIEERRGGGGLLGDSHWNLYTAGGQYVTTFNKARAYGPTVAAITAGITLPDVNANGTYAIAGETFKRQYVYEGTVLVYTQSISIFNIAAGILAASIPLKSPAIEIAKSIRFMPGSSTIIQVTYPSGENVFHTVAPGQPKPPAVPEGWAVAKSNANFAFQLKTIPQFWNYSVLSLMNLQTGQTQVLATASVESLGFAGKFSVYDVSPDGKFVVFGLPDGSKTQIQSITDPSRKVIIDGQSTLLGLTWTTLPSGHQGVILQNIGSSTTIDLAAPSMFPLSVTLQTFHPDGKTVNSKTTHTYDVKGNLTSRRTLQYSTADVITNDNLTRFGADGKPTDTEETFYTNGIASWFHRYEFAPGGLLILRYIKKTFAANGKTVLTNSTTEYHPNGAEKSVTLYYYNVNGLLTRTVAYTKNLTGAFISYADKRYDTNGKVIATYDRSGKLISPILGVWAK